MRAEALAPAGIFGYHVRYVVPLFQRPYVWNQQDQWEPLWDDVRAVALRLLRLWPLLEQSATPGRGTEVAGMDLARLVPPHFLGAIVVEQAPTSVGAIPVFHVIDGQQRLTTLQLLLDAAGRVAAEDGDAEDARRLQHLVFNDPAVRRDDEICKVWPTIADRDAYLAALTGDTAAATTGPPVAQAHAYFVEAIRAWAHEDTTAASTTLRLRVLAQAIAEHLRAVVIHLDPGDNPQGIFETLNHRGAPLLAADLIKNLVFRLAQSEGLDVVALYQKYWERLDGPYWRSYVTRGRQVVPRIDVFVHYWLIMRLVQEVRSDQIFTSFRDHLDEAGVRVEDLLRELGRDAAAYETIGAAPALRREPRDLFCYRVFGALDAGVMTPLYLWLTRWPASVLPVAERDRALAAIESWSVRRWLCGLSTKDNSNVVVDLLRALDAAGPPSAGYVIESFLYDQKSAARLWPGDDLVRTSVPTTSLTARALRPRLRMLLEAIEDHLRGEHGAPSQRDLSLEMLMPVAWREHWAGNALNAAAATRRDAMVHTLGNLTLVPVKLDAEISGLPWTDEAALEADLSLTGKRTELASHGRLRLNEELVAEYADEWTEESIAARTAQLTDVILAIWPRPGVEPTDTAPRGPGSIPAQTSVSAANASSTSARTGGTTRSAAPHSKAAQARGATPMTPRPATSPDSMTPRPATSPDSMTPRPATSPDSIPHTAATSSRVAAGLGQRLWSDYRADVISGTVRKLRDALDTGGHDDPYVNSLGARANTHTLDDDFDDQLMDGGEFAPGPECDTPLAGQGGRDAGGGEVDELIEAASVEITARDDATDPDDATESASDTPDGQAGSARYVRLTRFLTAQISDTIPMTFQQVEDVMQDPLPPSARTSIPFWSDTEDALGQAIVAGGFRPTNVDLWNERVVFLRDGAHRKQRKQRQSGRRRSGRQSGLDR